MMTSVILNILFSCVIISGKAYRHDYQYSSVAEGWLKFHRMPTSWDQARAICHAEGAVLLSPINQHLYQEMKRIMEMEKVPWGIYTGIHASFAKGVYTSVKGVPLSNIPVRWAAGEPNNHQDNEECLFMFTDGNMGDVNCTTVLPYICYKKKTKSKFAASNSCGTIDRNYTLATRSGSCFKFHREGATWRKAFLICASEGGHLAIINSHAEATELFELFAKHPAETITSDYPDTAYIGFVDWNNDGNWLTIHGDTLEEAGYSSWAKNQPDNIADKTKYGKKAAFCGTINRSAMLDDCGCNNILPFICEKEPNSLRSNHQEKQ